MIVSELETILLNEAGNTDISGRSISDITKRFDSLRGCALLPSGREKSTRHLKLKEIAAAILSISTDKTGFAGTASITLLGLKPVGGGSASFKNMETFGEVLTHLLENKESLESLVEIRLSCSEIYNNGYGRAYIKYRSNGIKKVSYYIGANAVSLLKEGAEKDFDPTKLISSCIVETVIFPSLLSRIQKKLEYERTHPPVVYPISDEDENEEKAKEKRAKLLSLTPSSRFLNLGVDNQVTWPRKETLVEFEGYKMILLPKTKENITSIHIDLHGNKITSEEAQTLINRFLSLLAWCDDNYAVLQGGWSGNPVPVPVAKRNLAFTTTTNWIFSRSIPDSEEAKKALSIYREGRNAEQNHLIGYAVLCFYKIIELKYNSAAKAKSWLKEKYPIIQSYEHCKDNITRFEAALKNKAPEVYLYTVCRTAVAHANTPFASDPDDFNELQRLYVSAKILRLLARLFIEEELGVSDSFLE